MADDEREEEVDVELAPAFSAANEDPTAGDATDTCSIVGSGATSSADPTPAGASATCSTGTGGIGAIVAANSTPADAAAAGSGTDDFETAADFSSVTFLYLFDSRNFFGQFFQKAKSL